MSSLVFRVDAEFRDPELAQVLIEGLAVCVSPFPSSTMPPTSSAAGADSDMIIKDEVVRTLGNELAKTRGAQDRLKTENDVLRRQLEDTRYRLRALEETERERAKSAKDVVSVSLRSCCLRGWCSAVARSLSSTKKLALSFRV